MPDASGRAILFSFGPCCLTAYRALGESPETNCPRKVAPSTSCTATKQPKYRRTSASVITRYSAARGLTLCYRGEVAIRARQRGVFRGSPVKVRAGPQGGFHDALFRRARNASSGHDRGLCAAHHFIAALRRPSLAREVPIARWLVYGYSHLTDLRLDVKRYSVVKGLVYFVIRCGRVRYRRRATLGWLHSEMFFSPFLERVAKKLRGKRFYD